MAETSILCNTMRDNKVIIDNEQFSHISSECYATPLLTGPRNMGPFILTLDHFRLTYCGK